MNKEQLVKMLMTEDLAHCSYIIYCSDEGGLTYSKEITHSPSEKLLGKIGSYKNYDYTQHDIMNVINELLELTCPDCKDKELF
jgi:hypothetical protein